MKTFRILLADDHKVVREGLRLLINEQEDMEVIGEAGNGKEALQKARALQPDVVVMDLTMPEMTGVEVTEQLKAERPEIKVVALTAHEDESSLQRLCNAGAVGYVLKNSAGDELLKAIRAVMAGGVHFDTTLASRALASHFSSTALRAKKATQLSEREKQVLILVAWGYSNKEAAGELGLSVKTIETYRAHIAEKLGLRTRTAIVRYALRQGWLQEPGSSQ